MANKKRKKFKVNLMPTKGNPRPAGHTYTPFRYSSDRLSIAKNMEQIYSDRGTIYWSAINEKDTPRWNHYYDKGKDQIIMNWYGREVNEIGADSSASELVQRLAQYPRVVEGSADAIPRSVGVADHTVSKPVISVYANQTHAAHERFKGDMEAALRRNGVNSVGMVNDTKRKEVIDLLATNKNENIKTYLSTDKGDSQESFESNASNKYEKRYEHNKTHLSKKRIPNYASGPTIKYDEYNKLYPLPDPTDPKLEVATEEKTWKSWDFIPFILHDLVNKKYLPFRSFINSLSLSISNCSDTESFFLISECVVFKIYSCFNS